MNANQFDKAKPWVERALNDSEPPTVFDWLVAARYHRHSGNKIQADHLYQDALDWASNYAPGQPILERQLQLAASRD